jgi:RsiW-degrading membrane proteinase PrsW (M82 family)
MPTNPTMLYIVIAVLAVTAAVLGYQLYEAKKDPKGFQINVGPGGVSMEKK